jgi:hypothetical protein
VYFVPAGAGVGTDVTNGCTATATNGQSVNQLAHGGAASTTRATSPKSPSRELSRAESGECLAAVTDGGGNVIVAVPGGCEAGATDRYESARAVPVALYPPRRPSRTTTVDSL